MALYSKIQDQKFSSDGSDDVSFDVDVGLLYEKEPQKYRPSKTVSWTILGIFWVVSVTLAIVITAFTVLQIQKQRIIGTFASGYSSDFDAVRQVINVQRRTFTGSPRFDEHGEEYIPLDSPSLKYVGSGPEVDAAWDELVKDRYFLLTDEEAEKTWGDNYTQFWNDRSGGYLGGLDMFHTLHCLDHLRKSFFPDMYTLDGIHGQMHQLHCIDHLRQMIQCNSDLTVIPSRWFEGINQNYIDSNMVHTCRDFTTVRKWASSRYNEVKPRNRDGTPREDSNILT